MKTEIILNRNIPAESQHLFYFVIRCQRIGLLSRKHTKQEIRIQNKKIGFKPPEGDSPKTH